MKSVVTGSDFKGSSVYSDRCVGVNPVVGGIYRKGSPEISIFPAAFSPFMLVLLSSPVSSAVLVSDVPSVLLTITAAGRFSPLSPADAVSAVNSRLFSAAASSAAFALPPAPVLPP